MNQPARRSTFLVIAGLGVLLTLPLVAATASHGAGFFAGERGHKRGDGRPPQPAPLAKLADFLALSSEQRASGKQIFERARASSEPLVSELRAKREALEVAIDAGDPVVVGNLVLEIAGLREQLKTQRLATRGELEALLTAEQKARYEVVRSWIDERREDRTQVRRGGRRPAGGSGDDNG